MAKDKFYRMKPHANAGARIGLSQIGFSNLGVLQIASGQMVTDQQDRVLLAEVLTASNNSASGQATGKRGHMPFRARTFIELNLLLRLGFSASGAQQIAIGAIVTNLQDRGLVAEILASMTPMIHQALVTNDSF